MTRLLSARRRALPRTHAPLVIAGHVWRRRLIGERVVIITLPIVNFGRDVRIDPTILVTLREHPRGRHSKYAPDVIPAF